MRFTKTHTSQEGPPHVLLQDYLEDCRRAYGELLSQDPSEPEVQQFLEKHPCMVPGNRASNGARRSPLNGLLITQPRLPAPPHYVPDFMWISEHSLAWFPIPIEIEAPAKLIFRQDRRLRQAFTGARDQLADWRSWFRTPENVLLFYRHFGIPPLVQRRKMELQMSLVYGRRSEFEADPRAETKRASLLPGTDEELMSFDRLEPDPALAGAITVRALGDGRYEAVWVPAVFELGPRLAGRLLHVDGIEDAIERNPEISDARKAFLRGRIPYWQEWARDPGMYSPGYGE